jgi:outer membrane lipoprotein
MSPAPCLRFALPLFAAAALAACVTTPPLDGTGARLDLPPYSATQEPAPGAATVLWGGMIVEVRNQPQTSEIVVLAYPLDKRQRPLLEQPTQGRFIAVVPGYLEPFDWPQGRFLTLRGQLRGTREGLIDEKLFVYPVVAVDDVHLWPAGFQNMGPRFSIGIGVGFE